MGQKTCFACKELYRFPKPCSCGQMATGIEIRRSEPNVNRHELHPGHSLILFLLPGSSSRREWIAFSCRHTIKRALHALEVATKQEISDFEKEQIKAFLDLI